MTNNLVRRVYEHKQKLVQGFSAKYNTDQLVYFESTNDAKSAISREKQIKDYNRNKKIALIVANNPDFIDIYNTLL